MRWPLFLGHTKEFTIASDLASMEVVSVIHVVCAVIESDAGLILACQRDDDRHLGGLWEFPGGKIEKGESAEEALIREIQEELGIVIEPISEMRFVVWEYKERTIQLQPYRCKITSGIPTALEHKALSWCPVSELEQFDWAGADLPIVRELIEESQEQA